MKQRGHDELWTQTPELAAIHTSDLVGLMNTGVGVFSGNQYKPQETMSSGGSFTVFKDQAWALKPRSN